MHDTAATASAIDSALDSADWTDPEFYARLAAGVADDGAGAADQPTSAEQGDTAAAPEPVAAPAAAAAPSAPAASSATPGAAATDAKPAIDGVLTRDGKHVIPYAVLESARQAEEAAKANSKALQARIEELERQNQQALAGSTPESKDAVQQFSDEEIEQLEADDPLLAKQVRATRAMSETIAALQARLAEQTAAAPAAAGTASPAPAQKSESELRDEAIAQSAHLARWMSGSTPEFRRAAQLDNVFAADPGYAAKSPAEKVAYLEKVVAAEFGITLPPPSTHSPPAAPAQARSTAIPSLSDLGGTTPVPEADRFAATSERDLLAAAQSMSYEELARSVGVAM